MKIFLKQLMPCFIFFFSMIFLNAAVAQDKNKTQPAPVAPDSQTQTKNSAISLSGFPFIFPGIAYLDSRLQYENSFTNELSVLVGLTYKYENFPDARIPYKDTAFGPNLYMKYYINDWFVNMGVEYLKVQVTNESKNIKAEDWTAVTRVIFGKRINVSESLFYEFGAGASYYFTDVVDPIDSKGYKKSVLPALHVAIGLMF